MKMHLQCPQTLGEWPFRLFRIQCDYCHSGKRRYGAYHTVRLVAEHGSEISPVALAEKLSGDCCRGRGLTKPAKMGQRKCMLYFPDLIIESNKILPWRPR